MDRTNLGERAFATTMPELDQTEAIEFVRFCHRRKRVGWPELYDEMCGVAGRGLYRGYGPEELAAIGIGFGLFQMPGLAMLVGRVVAEDTERRQRAAAAAVRTGPLEAITDHAIADGESGGLTDADAPEGTADHGSMGIAVAAGA